MQAKDSDHRTYQRGGKSTFSNEKVMGSNQTIVGGLDI